MRSRSSGYLRLFLAVGVTMLMGATGCPFDDGGGGGGGTITFNKGFAFIRNDDQNVYVVDESDFDSVGQLTTNGGNKHPSLSADGTQVVFVHGDGTSASIMTVLTDGSGAPRTVYTADATAGQKNFKNPVFSPDGTTIVFAYEVSTTSYLAKVAAADGSGFTTLTTGPLSYASPSFYPTGHANAGWVLAAAGNTIGQYTQLDRINVLGTPQLLPVTNFLGADVDSIVNRVALSADGSKVAFDGRLISASSAVRIFVQTLGGSTLQISEPGLGSASANHSFPTWTSATTVAFVSDEGGSNQTYVQSASSLGTGALTVPSSDQPWFGP